MRFRPNINPDVAASDVRDRVARVRGRLPSEIEEPIIAKVEADAQPVIYLSLTGEGLSALELTDFASRNLVNRLQTVTGVSEVRIQGERVFAMRIWIDRSRLAAYALTIQDVEAALRAQNVEIPAGLIEEHGARVHGAVSDRPDDAGAVPPISLKEANGFVVRLGDVAKVEIGARTERSAAWYNGTPSVTLAVVKQATANPLDVSAD